MSTTPTKVTPVQARPKQQPGPWDNVQVMLYTGSHDNQGRMITLADARRIVRIGDHELYVKALGGRITVADYTAHVQSQRRAWIEAGYDPKQVKKQFDGLKGALPAVTWSGLFPMARGVDLISQHSGMIAADVDHLTTEEIDGQWESLSADPHIWFMFLSPSETGIKIILPVSGLMDLWPIQANMTQSDYARVANQFQYAAYFAVRRYMSETHGLQIDGACKDSSRLCYLPFDDECYSNRTAEPLKVGWAADVEQQIEEERARERQEAAQKRDQAKAKAKSAPPAPKAKSAPASTSTSTEPVAGQGSPGDDGPFHRVSHEAQERLVDNCLGVLHPDAVPPGFGAPDDPGDRHRWDTAIGMAIHSWDSGDRGLEKYLAWGQASAHKSQDERSGSWSRFNGDGKVTVGTLLKFGGEAGVVMPWAGQRPEEKETKETTNLSDMLADHGLIAASKADKLAVRGLMDFADLPSDPNAVLLGERWLLRKSAACVFAPSGVGKSTTIAQASTLWSLGQPAFGIKPSKPLRILCFQAEDDDLDIREISAGVKVRLKLSPEQCAQVSYAVKVVRTRKSGVQFFKEDVLPAIVAFKPDLLIINPVMSYADCDMLKQDEAANFFRRMVGEILESFNIAAILIHHTPKPTNTDITKLNRYQEQYLAFGSSDLINWVRAALMIWPTGVEGVFEFRASKRGEKIGWRVAKPGAADEDDAILVPVYTRLFKHWTTKTKIAGEDVEVTAWIEAGPDDEMDVAQARKKQGRRGGLKKTFGAYDVIKHMPAHQAVTLKQIVERVKSSFRAKASEPPSQRTIQRALKEAAGEVEVKGQQLQLIKHEGTNYTRL